MINLKQRAWNSMIGLAIGDAISWPAMYHRSFLLPLWTRRIRREIDLAAETDNVIITPMPFSLNQPAQNFNISPTDDSEWAAFSAGILLKSGDDLETYSKCVLEEWINLANTEKIIRGGVSTQAALNNIRNEILPPQCGKENPHYFDDGAICRAVPIGIICAGQPEKAARMAEIDASVTNFEDGVWAAQAMAVAISLVCSEIDLNDAISLAIEYLPGASWIRRAVEETIKLTENVSSIFSILPELHNNIVNREYSYGNVAPETLALTFAIARLHGDNFENAVLTASSFAKCGDTLPALTGALAGAMHSHSFASENWLNAVTSLKGICIPDLANTNYLKLAEQLSNIAGFKIKI